MIRKLLASLLMAVSTILVVQQAIAQNNALSFDGVNDYVDLGTPGQLAIERTNAFTWEAWIKTSSGAQQTMFANMQSGAPNRGFDIFIQNGQLRLTLSSTYGSNYLETYTSTLVNTGNWTHVAISYDGSSAASGVKMYINGVSQTVGIHFNGLSSTIQIADHVIMGARNGLVFPFNGQMDEVRWWNQVRTASQIAGYRQCRLANSGSNLLLNYHFNQGTAGANNAGIVTLTNDGSAAINGTLVNFGLTGVASNWVDGSANGVNASCQANRYVKAGASPGGNGLSWATAYSNLQDAIQEALSGNGISEIWVAIGTYYPDALPGQDNNRAAFFTMRNNLGVYGGFAGTETALDQRNWATNPTILSGEIQQDADSTNNSFRIFLNDNNGLNNTAILDGFTITGAYNTDLRGGGMYNNASSPSIANCRFVNNSARNGGGIANYYFVAPQITNCSFTGNTAVLTGGGIFNYESAEAVITNCSFYGNKVPTTNGGAIYNLFANSKIVNSICWGNGTEIVNSGATPDVTYSTVQGGYAGTGNLATYPMFLDTANADLRLMSGSPARDNGSNIANTTSRDLAGKARIVGGTIDRGAYEWTACSGITRLYVKWDAVGAGDGASWTSAFKTLREALAVAAGNACIDQIWVARGTYYPDDPGLENDRGASFNMRNNLAIYGGFAGNETSPGQRKLAANPSILSGEIQQDADRNNNSYHVISNYGNSLNNTAILDGFTITGGCANGGSQSGWGAGMLNYLSSPTIRNCIFSGNTAQMGGGMFNTSLFSVPSIINCIFSGNLATTGGGMALWSSSATISNCSFSGNSAFIAGAIANLNGSLNAPAIIHNTIIYGNSSGLNNNTDAPPLIYNSLVQERAGGSYGNLDGSINPFFVDAPSYTNAPFTGGNYRLRFYSPAINAGNNDSIPAVISTDIAGYARINEDTVDMGAHEFGCGSLSRLYVKQAAAGAGHGYDWANAYTTLTGALAYAQSCDAITEIWVAQGTYYPSTTDRSLSFDLKNGLAIYGGFAGTETSLSERNSVWQHATILSGNGVTGRSTNVVRAGNVNNTALLDGFYIQDGLANDNGFNSGAGLQLINSSPVIRDCIIRNNRSEYARWAALSVSNPALPDSLLVEHCVFQNNTMQYTTDGVIGVSQGKAIFKNCVFTQNTGVFDADVATIKSCNNTIWGNEGSLLRAFANSHIDIVNSIVNSAPVIVNQSTVAIHNSRVPTALLGYGSGNLDIDPQLRNTADGDGVDNTWGTTDDGYALKPHRQRQLMPAIMGIWGQMIPPTSSIMFVFTGALWIWVLMKASERSPAAIT